MTKHTPEPWKAGLDKPFASRFAIFSGDACVADAMTERMAYISESMTESEKEVARDDY